MIFHRINSIVYSLAVIDIIFYTITYSWILKHIPRHFLSFAFSIVVVVIVVVIIVPLAIYRVHILIIKHSSRGSRWLTFCFRIHKLELQLIIDNRIQYICSNLCRLLVNIACNTIKLHYSNFLLTIIYFNIPRRSSN